MAKSTQAIHVNVEKEMADSQYPLWCKFFVVGGLYTTNIQMFMHYAVSWHSAPGVAKYAREELLKGVPFLVIGEPSIEKIPTNTYHLWVDILYNEKIRRIRVNANKAFRADFDEEFKRLQA